VERPRRSDPEQPALSVRNVDVARVAEDLREAAQVVAADVRDAELAGRGVEAKLPLRVSAERERIGAPIEAEACDPLLEGLACAGQKRMRRLGNRGAACDQIP
jgi:hypothetical protein